MARQSSPYAGKAEAGERTRVVVMMPSAEADAIDEWAVPAGMPDRTSAVRFLIKKGLAAVAATPATGCEA